MAELDLSFRLNSWIEALLERAMNFVCKTGGYKEIIDATSYEDAAAIFLEHITNGQIQMTLGEIIHIECETKETFFCTEEILGKLGKTKNLRLYKN